MINLEGIKKPSFYAFKFLAELGTEDVHTDDQQSWVTKSPDGSLQALLWDYTPVVPPAGQVDQTFYKMEQPATAKGNLELHLFHIPNGKYTFRLYRIGYKQNDAYTAYVEMGSPHQLTRAQVSILNSLSAGMPLTKEDVTIRKGIFTHSMPLRTNDIYFLTLTPETHQERNVVVSADEVKVL